MQEFEGGRLCTRKSRSEYGYCEANLEVRSGRRDRAEGSCRVREKLVLCGLSGFDAFFERFEGGGKGKGRE